LGSVVSGPDRIERTFVGAYGADAPRALSAAGESIARPAGGLAVAWTGPPAQAPPSAERPACLLDGEIYNLEEIAQLARVPAQHAPEITLASAYMRLGESLLAELRGEFALLLWDARRRTGLLARDQLGSGSVFIHAGGGRLLFASELRNLLEVLPRTPAPDREALVNWLAAGAVPSGKTLYEGVVSLAPASALRLHAGRWEAARYWAPRYQDPRALDVDDAADELGSAVFESVGRRLKGRRNAGVLVSGGLDSGTVLAVADRLTAENGTSIRAYSAVFPDHVSMDESRLIQLQAERHRLPHVQLPVAGGSPLQSGVRYLDRWRVPPPVPGHFVWEPLLGAAAADGAECMLDGELGDELFGAALFLVADRIRRGHMRGAVELARRFPGVGPSPGRRLLVSLLFQYGVAACLPAAPMHLIATRRAAPAWLARAEAHRFARSLDPEPWRRLEGPRWWALLADAVVRGPDRLGFFDYFRRRGRAVRVPAQHPFLDVDLIELVLRLPPEHGFDPYFNRPLLRRAMRGIVPDEVRTRRGKTYFDPLLVDCVGGEDRRLVMRLLGARDAEVLSVADGAEVRALLDGGPSRHPQGAPSWTRDVWRLATAECWLRSQADPTFPRKLLDGLASTRRGTDPHSTRIKESSVYGS
jgi:asparagine synthase (glutamine-hydrolysing)